MNLEKVVFGFFVVLAATLNFGYFLGDLGDPHVHNIYELYAAVLVNLVAVVLKLGDRTQIGAIQLATSLVAVMQLAAGSIVWVSAGSDPKTITVEAMSSIVSLSGGALIANLVSLALLIGDTLSYGRR